MDKNQEHSDVSLIEKYKITDGDEDSKNWVRMLDFETSIKTEADWYSTKTFQVFLDALDINQPANLERNRDINKESKPKIPKSTPEPQEDRKRSEIGNKQTKTSSSQQKVSHHVETILSAEALKILSELPDLSHMSGTRSFMFPSRGDASSSKKR